MNALMCFAEDVELIVMFCLESYWVANKAANSNSLNSVFSAELETRRFLHSILEKLFEFWTYPKLDKIV